MFFNDIFVMFSIVTFGRRRPLLYALTKCNGAKQSQPGVSYDASLEGCVAGKQPTTAAIGFGALCTPGRRLKIKNLL
jgi:hypothetical protein